jgi:hypothetical protein
MQMKAWFNMVAGCVFAVVAVLHIARIVLNVRVYVESVEMPFWISWIGLFGASLLAVWGFCAGRR